MQALPRSLATTYGISVDFFSSGYLDVSVRRVRFTLPMYSAGNDPKGRVSPFRDLRIKAFCQLPVAFRRLTRLSSPVIAKASTTCTYSLDPITLSPRPFDRSAIGVSHLCPIHTTSMNRLDTIKNPFSFSTSTQTVAHPRFSENHFLYFFQIFKDQTFVVRR